MPRLQGFQRFEQRIRLPSELDACPYAPIRIINEVSFVNLLRNRHNLQDNKILILESVDWFASKQKQFNWSTLYEHSSKSLPDLVDMLDYIMDRIYEDDWSCELMQSIYSHRDYFRRRFLIGTEYEETAVEDLPW